MGLSQMAGQYERRLDENMATPRDINVGSATVPYGWTERGEGWRLPGGVITQDKRLAERAATIINREISRTRK